MELCSIPLRALACFHVIAPSSAGMLSSSAWSMLDCCHIYVTQEGETGKIQCKQFFFKSMRQQLPRFLSKSKQSVTWQYPSASQTGEMQSLAAKTKCLGRKGEQTFLRQLEVWPFKYLFLLSFHTQKRPAASL